MLATRDAFFCLTLLHSLFLPSDSPAGSSYQEAFEAFKSDFEQLGASLDCRGSQHIGPSTGTTTSSQQGRGGGGSATTASSDGARPNSSSACRGGSGGGGAAAAAPMLRDGSAPYVCSSSGDSRSAEHAKLGKVLAWPGAFGLYCWACSVVERSAVQVLPQHDDGEDGDDDGRAPLSSSSSSRWAVLPLVSAIPTQLRDAILHVECVAAVGGVVPALGASQSAVLRVRASCLLPEGLLLSPLLLLPHDGVDALMDGHGPEAMGWRRLLEQQRAALLETGRRQQQGAHSSSPKSEAQQPGSGGITSQPTSRLARVAVADRLLPPSPPPLPLSLDPELTGIPSDVVKAETLPAPSGMRYELYISPSEEDPLYQEKLELLTAAGLGTVHYLTAGFETEVGEA